MSKRKNSKEKTLKLINKDVNNAKAIRDKSYEKMRKDLESTRDEYGINENVKNVRVQTAWAEKNLLIGKFIGNERGFGFVEIENRDEDIFIPASAVKSAMNGDIVAVRITEEKNGRKESRRNYCRNFTKKR